MATSNHKTHSPCRNPLAIGLSGRISVCQRRSKGAVYRLATRLFQGFCLCGCLCHRPMSAGGKCRKRFLSWESSTWNVIKDFGG